MGLYKMTEYNNKKYVISMKYNGNEYEVYGYLDQEPVFDANNIADEDPTFKNLMFYDESGEEWEPTYAAILKAVEIMSNIYWDRL